MKTLLLQRHSRGAGACCKTPMLLLPRIFGCIDGQESIGADLASDLRGVLVVVDCKVPVQIWN